MFDFASMTPQHVVYIPLVALLSLVIGYIAGARVTRNALERQRRRMKE